jgi:hypothetical protein
LKQKKREKKDKKLAKAKKQEGNFFEKRFPSFNLSSKNFGL